MLVCRRAHLRHGDAVARSRQPLRLQATRSSQKCPIRGVTLVLKAPLPAACPTNFSLHSIREQPCLSVHLDLGWLACPLACPANITKHGLDYEVSPSMSFVRGWLM